MLVNLRESIQESQMLTVLAAELQVLCGPGYHVVDDLEIDWVEVSDWCGPNAVMMEIHSSILRCDFSNDEVIKYDLADPSFTLQVIHDKLVNL